MRVNLFRGDLGLDMRFCYGFLRKIVLRSREMSRRRKKEIQSSAAPSLRRFHPNIVADTSPLNYLILIDQIGILEPMYGRIAIPVAVHNEL
jgi:hypothetical protein